MSEKGTKWGPKQRIFDKLTETCQFIKIRDFFEKNIHQVFYHLVHSVCAISMNKLCVIKARQGIHRKFLKLVFVITSKQMVDII